MLGKSPILTERLWATFASSAFRRVQLKHDLTDQELAENIGCCAGTVENARNQKGKGQLSGRTFVNLLRLDPLAFEGVLNHFGRRSVPITAKCDTDELVSTAGAVHRLASVKCPNSPGGSTITDNEALSIEGDLDAAIEALSSLKSRCERIRADRELAA